ncbi:putative Carbonic anhydrase 2 [Hypsibius exemplaris]|uniref:Carbonic anhydrase n=1 Tax=Hypsibius exemplaris TaxID=2072580 RepID=A0A9X6N9V9_HYPEX|nr:putative Carbonic anhydrase 2 [Hypsibius exemplaris]
MVGSRRGSRTTVVYDSREPHGVPEKSLLLTLRTTEPAPDEPLTPTWKRQSPIDIQTADVKFDPSLCLSPLTISYPRRLQESAKLVNTGQTWRINVPSSRYFVEGGPLSDRYQLDQAHAHWGESDIEGSEHYLDGLRFAGEMHFVHWNENKYANASQAINHEDGICVIGVFFKLGQHNEELQKLTDILESVKYAACEIGIDHLELDLIRLLPRDLLKYWTYSGSLTTEPYTECVTWIILAEPIEVSKEQIRAMRHLLKYKSCEKGVSHGEHLGRCRENCRTVQTWLDTPTISASFRPRTPTRQQSPIDISSSTTSSAFQWDLSPELPFELNYPSGVRDACTVVNTGRTWKVLVDDERFWIKGGPLKNAYTLDQFHAHWGETDDCGSEHTLDGRPFSGEIHFVHWNRKYGTMEKACEHRDGLAVVGVFLEVGETNAELEKLTNAVDDIRYADSTMDLVNIDFKKLLPNLDDPAYWTYPGSLTTPPYTECVVWIVLKETVKVSTDQLRSMRSLYCYKECDSGIAAGGSAEDSETSHHGHGQLLQNYRNVQTLRTDMIRPSSSCAR